MTSSGTTVSVPSLARQARSKVAAAETLAQRDLRIAQLESHVALLTASRVAMIRAVGELGGSGKWAKFFESYSDVRARLTELGALPEADVSPLPSHEARKKVR
jgi:hypothetical protein